MKELLETKWKSTRKGVSPLKGEDLVKFYSKLNHEWELMEDMKLQKNFKFNNFNQALKFANLVGRISDEVNHHPDLHIAWGKCEVIIWTHLINGLAEMDFVYASRVEKIYQDEFSPL